MISDESRGYYYVIADWLHTLLTLDTYIQIPFLISRPNYCLSCRDQLLRPVQLALKVEGMAQFWRDFSKNWLVP